MHALNQRCFSAERVASNGEVLLLALTLLCLPTLEAPKNIFSVLFCFLFLINSFRFQSFGQNSLYDVPIFGLAVILWLSPLFSDLGDAVSLFGSAPRWTLLAFFVLAAIRLNYSKQQFLLLSAFLVCGGVYAVWESMYAWSFNDKLYPEFRSVGHVNHSSMYTLVTVSVGLGLTFVRYKFFKLLGLSGVVSTLIFLPPSRSIVGGLTISFIIAAFIALVVMQKPNSVKLKTGICAVLAVMTVLVGLFLTPLSEDFILEVIMRFGSDEIFSGRDKMLFSALAVWDQHPLIGSGWFSFGPATSEERVREVLQAKGLSYDSEFYGHALYHYYPHGHNLWTTLLVERGLVGVILVTTLLFLYFRTFFPVAVRRDGIDQTDRGAAVGALLVALGFLVAGIGNTTMMNEHGHAGMAFISIVYGYLRGRAILSSKKH
ncbi:hypothetical protein HKCCA1058_05940 [Rhodobacterales bacterium HKCCA1058]|nr:hypothetical protein [Rhodobacterales bacterium HKCCA1058]